MTLEHAMSLAEEVARPDFLERYAAMKQGRTIRMTVNNQSLEFSGDVTIELVREVMTLWLNAVLGDAAQQSMIDAFVARLKATNDKLAARVAATTPSA